MNSKKIIAAAFIIMMCLAPAVLCVSESSAAEHDEASMKDAVFSRATVTYLEGVRYAEHMDRSDCWFFIDGSSNEIAFTKYVTRQSDVVPTVDDSNSLKDALITDPNVKCDVYALGLEPKFCVNAPLLTADYVGVKVKAGQRLTAEMNCDYGNMMVITKSGSSETSHWLYDRQYMTTASEDTEYYIFPQNESINGGKIDIKDLFVTVSYNVSVSSGSESNGNSIVIAVVLFIIGAAVIAMIILCSRKISWAKGAEVPCSIPDESGDGTEEDKK